MSAVPGPEGGSLDRYVVLDYLAEGGMGAIYLGKKVGPAGFEREVVLKQLLPELTQQPQLIELFLREARLTATLDHPNIVRTLDLVATGADYFIVMEYVRGADLRAVLRRAKRRQRPLSVQAALFIAREVAAALAYAHGRRDAAGNPLGLIHRDVSPSNVLLGGAGEVKLSDFGIAKARGHQSVFYKVKGKVGYMSPEQARGQTVDLRSDLYSLGVVLWEMLAGQRLFIADLGASADAIYRNPVRGPSTLRPDLPPLVDGLVLRMLAHEPAHRFQAGEELMEAVAQVAARLGLRLAAHDLTVELAAACGPDPDTWRRVEDVVPEGTARMARATSGAQASDARTAEITPAAAIGLVEEEEEEEEEDGDGNGGPPTHLHGGRRRSSSASHERSRLTGTELRSVVDGGTFPSPLAGAGARRASPHRAPVARDLLAAQASTEDGPIPMEQALAAMTGAREASASSSIRRDRRAEAPAARPASLATARRASAVSTRRLLPLALVSAGVAGAAIAWLATGGAVIPSPPPFWTAWIAPRAANAPASMPTSSPPPSASAAVPIPAPVPQPPFPAVDLGTSGGGVFTIDSVPRGASASFDGRPICATPCVVTGVARAGAHLLVVTAPGDVPFGALVDLARRGEDHLLAVLHPVPAHDASAWIAVDVDPPGELRIDGRAVGFVTSQGSYPVPAGEHLVGVSRPDQSGHPWDDIAVGRGHTAFVRLRY